MESEMLRHCTQFHDYQDLVLILSKVNDFLNKIKLSGPWQQTQGIIISFLLRMCGPGH